MQTIDTRSHQDIELIFNDGSSCVLKNTYINYKLTEQFNSSINLQLDIHAMGISHYKSMTKIMKEVDSII